MKAKLLKLVHTIGLQRLLLNEHKTRSLSRLQCSDDSASESTGNALSDLSSDIDSCNESEASEAAYISWLKEHPSALCSFERMMKAAKGKRIVVFLDYDGTLSPIVNDPDRAFMSDEMRAAVRGVSKYFPTAIISGRGRDKVKEFVQLHNVYYAGSHGMDIMAPPKPIRNSDGKCHPVSLDNGNEVLFQPAKKFLPAIQKISVELEEHIQGIPGARLEDNKFCVSVHFRQVNEEYVSILRETVKSVVAKYPDFHLTRGKKTLGFNNPCDVLPLYIGDDITDEDAFEAIERRGQGYPIIVSSVPKDTKALYSLRDPSEVLTFLLRLARWRRASYGT